MFFWNPSFSWDNRSVIFTNEHLREKLDVLSKDAQHYEREIEDSRIRVVPR